MATANVWYRGTILWALAGIGLRNQFLLKDTEVAVTAWAGPRRVRGTFAGNSNLDDGNDSAIMPLCYGFTMTFPNI